MPATTVSIQCDVSLPTSLEFTSATFKFRLSEPDYDTLDNETITTTEVTAVANGSGVATVSLWPVDRGVRNSFYSVVLSASIIVGGVPQWSDYTLGVIRPPSSGAPHNLADLLAQSSGGIIVGSTIYATLADAVQAALDAAAAGSDPIQAIAARDAALAAASASAASATASAASATASAAASIAIYSTYADATAALAGLPEGKVIEVLADETRSGTRTRYQKVSGVYVFRLNFDTILTYAFASLPTPIAGLRIMVSGERNGTVLAWSDGTYWRRASDGRVCQSAAISYWINGTTGSDVNNGTAIGTPIKTLTQLKALVAALPIQRRAGLRFVFARNTTIDGFWFLAAENAGCRFEAYGSESLARPLFDCADTVLNASFTATAGQPNCYDITITPTIQVAPTEVPSVWVNGERFAYVATQTLCNAHPNTFTHPAAPGVSPITITVNSGTNPTVDGKVYVMAMRSCAIDAVLAPEVEFHNLWGRRNYGSYGSFAMGDYGVARGLLVEDGNSHNIFFGPFSVLEDVEALNCNHGHIGSATMFIGFDNPIIPGSWAELTRCRARITRNSLKPASTIVALNSTSPFTVQVSPGHSFVVGEHVLIEGAGGATWANNARWYVSTVAGDVLTLQLHSYATNRVAAFDARFIPAWTSGGVVRLAPTAQANVIGFYNHGPGTGLDTSMWDYVQYTDCETIGCSVGFSAADCRVTTVERPIVQQYNIAFDQGQFGTMKVRDGEANNTPAVTSATASRIAASARMEIEGTTFVINSTGNHLLTGAGSQLMLNSVRHEGFASLVRGTSTGQRVEMARVINAPNVNLSQSNLLNFNASTTGLTVLSDYNDFGGYAGAFLIVNVSHADLAAYRIATGQDVNSKP